jgi:hypothetical protein
MPFRDVRGTLPLLAYRHKLMGGFFPLCSLLLSPKSDTKNSCTFTIEMLLRGFELSNLRTYMSISARTHARKHANARAHTHTFFSLHQTLVSPHLHNQAQFYSCITRTIIFTSAHPRTTLQLHPTPTSAHPDKKFRHIKHYSYPASLTA